KEMPGLPDEPVVAKIGDRVITARDFRNNYETGFSHLKTGPNPKKTYLDYMIKEKLLALQGFQLGLDKSESVKLNEQQLFQELMVEALLDKEVKSKIKITPEEIRQEINKSKVSFKFRYWVEPTPEKARLVVADMRERGYAAVLDDIIYNNPERMINPKRYETDYLTYLEVPAEVLNAIKDLPYGDISDPVELNGKFFIFQVLDIRRRAITENEYKAKASTFEQIIFYREYQKAITNYTVEMMQSKNVVTKGEAFNILARALQEWLKIKPEIRELFPIAVKNATEERPALYKLKGNLSAIFITYNKGDVTIGEFLPFINTARLRRQPKDKTFKEVLNSEVKNAIRDYFFVKKAEKLGLQDSPKVKGELKLWRDKWVYNETRKYYAKDLKIDEKEARQYFARNKNRYKIRKDDEPAFSNFRRKAQQDAYRHQLNLILQKEVESLKKRYPVLIYRAVLDTIRVTDFGKSRGINVQFFKGGTNRPALPVVDPLWEPLEE
ncbi:MAG: hypothetical protein ACE5GL_04090, partial [Calditrichia bacterium]